MTLCPARFRCFALLLFVASLAPLCAETWYIRADGGTRFSEKAIAGQCDGKADAAYPGKGTNRHCAFSDYRYLWDDQASYGVQKWVIAGGDTVILDNKKQWRVGFDQGKSPNDKWCIGMSGPLGCSNPPIPAGTVAQHTRILGRNFANCKDNAAKTQIFGGFGVYAAMDLTGAQYLDVQCLEITRHSQCVTHGDPMLPAGCRRDFPFDDADSDGIVTNVKTHDLLLQDLWIHGHTDRGIIGPIGGLVTAIRVDIAYNAMAGWDFDDGHGTPSEHAVLNMSESVIEWSGCAQEYPITHEHPAIACYGQSSGGYGDGIGTPMNTGMDVAIDHSIFRYNVQDGEDFGHIDTGSHTLRITNSYSYGNGGGQFKWGANFTNVLFVNNLVVGNCIRMSQPIPGTPASFNTHLADFCRAGDALSFNFRQGGTAVVDNNTIVSYAPTTMDLGCWDPSCSASKLVFRNNIVLGYDNPGTYSLGGKPGGPGGFYAEKPIGHITRSNNLFYGLRNGQCQATEVCTDPKFANEPRFSRDSDLDNFDFRLALNSPALRTGTRLPDLKNDYSGKARPVAGNYSMGAIEP